MHGAKSNDICIIITNKDNYITKCTTALRLQQLVFFYIVVVLLYDIHNIHCALLCTIMHITM